MKRILKFSYSKLFGVIISITQLFLLLSSCGDNIVIIEPQGVPPNVRSIIVAPDTVFFEKLPIDEDLRVKITFVVIAEVEESEVPFSVVEIALLNGRGESIVTKQVTPPSRSQTQVTLTDSISLQLRRSDIDDFTLVCNAIDMYGRSGDNARKKITIILPNTPPVLLSATAPESVETGDFLILKATAVDKDGLEDIDFVKFFSRRPDGILANQGNPILMFDDGGINPQSGDEIAGDGIFSFKILVPQESPTGTFTYTFFAQDRFGATSDSLVRQTLIRRP